VRRYPWTPISDSRSRRRGAGSSGGSSVSSSCRTPRSSARSPLEPTPGSAGPEIRLEEARKAAEILGVARRVTLELPNRRLFDTFEARVMLAKEFRKYRPRLVIGLGGKTPAASPDHYQASLITESAVFYSKLTKWEEHFGELEPYIIPKHLECSLSFRDLSPSGHPTVVVDISDTLETKLAAAQCYVSQFPPAKAHFADRLRAFAIQQGMAAGFAAGETFASPTALGTRDLMGMLFEQREIRD
jgi:LmbE family N-acetylglucosaminyl deacetylase